MKREGASNFPPEESRIRNLPVWDRFLPSILSGHKTIDVRVNTGQVGGIKEGDLLRFVAPEGDVKVRVKRVWAHDSIAAILRHEDLNKIAPGVPKEDLPSLARQLFRGREDQIDRYGLALFEFEKVSR